MKRYWSDINLNKNEGMEKDIESKWKQALYFICSTGLQLG